MFHISEILYNLSLWLTGPFFFDYLGQLGASNPSEYISMDQKYKMGRWKDGRFTCKWHIALSCSCSCFFLFQLVLGERFPQKKHIPLKCHLKLNQRECLLFPCWCQMIGCCFYSLLSHPTFYSYTWYIRVEGEETCLRFKRLKATLNHLMFKNSCELKQCFLI